MPILIRGGGKSANLQEKTISPTTIKTIYTPDDGYDGFSKVTALAMKTQTKTVTPTTSQQIITPDSGYDALRKVTVNALTTVTQATPSISVSSSGLITASATQSSGYVSSGTKSSAKQLSTKDSTTYTPGTNNQTISAGTYLTGTQTIKGDSNLVANNIKSGVSIFGVNGSYEGGSVTKVFSGTVDATSSSTLIISLPEDVSNLTLSMFALARRKADAESGDGILSYSSFPRGAECGFGGLSSKDEYAAFGSPYVAAKCSGNVLEIIAFLSNPDLQFCTSAMYNYLVVFESN